MALRCSLRRLGRLCAGPLPAAGGFRGLHRDGSFRRESKGFTEPVVLRQHHPATGWLAAVGLGGPAALGTLEQMATAPAGDPPRLLTAKRSSSTREFMYSEPGKPDRLEDHGGGGWSDVSFVELTAAELVDGVRCGAVHLLVLVLFVLFAPPRPLPLPLPLHRPHPRPRPRPPSPSAGPHPQLAAPGGAELPLLHRDARAVCTGAGRDLPGLA